ncbi:MAG TPA: hypothetical protein VGW75_18480 [Solirubrobacteraceae bacterium]|jgi:hypothetical protein|nr:hypothetical protein [Solirubrobacteraceae bacterium]
MPRRVSAALLAAALLAAGCGGENPEPSSGGAPAVTSGRAYELGGADGSGADGYEKRAPRGGIAAGQDTEEPGDQPFGDAEQKPPRSLDDDR